MAERTVNVSINVADLPAVKAAILAAYAKGLEDGEAKARNNPGGLPEVVHACPVGDSGVTPCCGRTPFELPRHDRMTVTEDDSALVTCKATR